jgi:two-component system OmpR family sensor kinase
MSEPTRGIDVAAFGPDPVRPDPVRPDDVRPPDPFAGTAPEAVDVTPGDDAGPADEPAGEPDDGPAAGAARRPAGSRLAAIPLRTQLVAVLVGTLLLALAATGFGVQWVLRGYLVQQIDDQLSATYEQAVGGDDRLLSGLTRTDDDDRRGPAQFATRVIVPSRPDVNRTNGSGPERATPLFTTISYDEAKELDGAVFQLESANGSPWRAVVVPVVVTPRFSLTSYPGTVTLALPTAPVDESVQQLRLFTLSIGGAAIAVFALLGWLAIRRAFRPLVEVEETAALIAGGDLSRRIQERPTTTEVGRLTTSLNTMLSHIEAAFRAREASEARTRRFAADASHELRTPLAAIRGFAELYRQGAVPTDDVPRTMRRIEDEATRMGGLVEDLLLLARLDEQRPGRVERVDLTVLAGDAVHDARGLDPNRPVQLVGLRPGVGPVPSGVVGDEDRLRQVVANLVANAVRHTAPGTPVEVAVGTETGADGTRTAVLEVRDHGQGLSPEQAERIFERFYRADSSRQRGKGGGSGLGLSIVSAVVSAHHGQVGVRTTPGGGATFRVSLPAAAPE